MAALRTWLPLAASIAVLAAVLGSGLENPRRVAETREGALLKDRWRLRLVSPEVAEETADRGYLRDLRKYARRGQLDTDPYLLELVGTVFVIHLDTTIASAGAVALWLTARSLTKAAPAWGLTEAGFWPRWRWVLATALPCLLVWAALYVGQSG